MQNGDSEVCKIVKKSPKATTKRREKIELRITRLSRIKQIVSLSATAVLSAVNYWFIPFISSPPWPVAQAESPQLS